MNRPVYAALAVILASGCGPNPHRTGIVGSWAGMQSLSVRCSDESFAYWKQGVFKYSDQITVAQTATGYTVTVGDLPHCGEVPARWDGTAIVIDTHECKPASDPARGKFVDTIQAGRFLTYDNGQTAEGVLDFTRMLDDWEIGKDSTVCTFTGGTRWGVGLYPVCTVDSDCPLKDGENMRCFLGRCS